MLLKGINAFSAVGQVHVCKGETRPYRREFRVILFHVSNYIVDYPFLCPSLFRQAHNEYVMAEKKREEWELKNHRDGEILEMVQIFEVCNGKKTRTLTLKFSRIL